MREAIHPIQMVSRLTGLSVHVIRIWEQRYQAVEPARTGSKRRLYSKLDIERLKLLREVTLAGHNIGRVAKLPTEKLRDLAGAPASPCLQAQTLEGEPATAALLKECLEAITTLDAQALDEAMKKGTIALGGMGFLQRLVAPLLRNIGALWREGTLTAAHEHFATAGIRSFLGNVAKPFGAIDRAPLLLVATPAGQVHELGALLAAAMASNLGWRVTYLGASLPAAEIAGAVLKHRARALALSLIYPEDDPNLEVELLRLRELVPTGTAILVGGRAASAYSSALEKIGATTSPDLQQFGLALDSLRRPAKAKEAAK